MKPGPAALVMLLLYSFTSFMCESPTGQKIPAGKISIDTTAQDFSFRTYQFGSGEESGILNDVWVFDQDNIWAVGYVSTDTVPPSNILHWNGREWETIGHLLTPSGLESIWALDTSDIYFAAGNIAHYKNGKFEIINTYLNYNAGQGIGVLWGNSDNNIWGAGPSGTIIHFDGVRWGKIEFDRSRHFSKLTGSMQSGTAYALAKNTSDETQIVRLRNGLAEVIYDSQTDKVQLDAWTMSLVNENEIYAAGTKIWKINTETGQTEVLYDPPFTVHFEQCCSHAANDVYFLGSDNSGSVLVHYNGSRFTRFPLPESYEMNGDLFAVGNMAVSVGSSDNKASIIEIIRN
ncbi:MAG: hypothetical protein ACM34K_11840 [Bacillota bacterium]